LYKRLDRPPPRTWAVMSASASPGLKIGGVSHDIVTRGSATRACTTWRRSAVIFGVVTETAGTAGPRFNVPKYLVTSALACAVSNSPTTARVALFGA
jgi:hypothetical protein